MVETRHYVVRNCSVVAGVQSDRSHIKLAFVRQRGPNERSVHLGVDWKRDARPEVIWLDLLGNSVAVVMSSASSRVANKGHVRQGGFR